MRSAQINRPTAPTQINRPTTLSGARARSEARAARHKYSPTAVEVYFAGYLVDDLRQRQGVLAPRGARADCPCCLGTHCSTLPGSVSWRLVQPCGHWVCGGCEGRVGALCPECNSTVQAMRSREWPGQCVAAEPDPGGRGQTPSRLGNGCAAR